MTKFIKKTALLLGIAILVSFAFVVLDIFVVKNQASQGYNAALIDKIDRLKSIQEPKIILVGNSNVAFGFNSEMIEQAFDMPVVNMGLHGGIGDGYYEDIIEPYINEGDIVVLGYSSFDSNEYFPDKGLALNMLEKNRELWIPVSQSEKISLLKAYPYYVYSCFSKFITFSGNKSEGNSYSRDAFNEYGDITYKPNEVEKYKGISVWEGTLKIPSAPTDDTAKRINEFNNRVNEKGAILVVTAVPVYYCEYTPEREQYQNLEKLLNEKLDCDMISSYEDYFLEPEFFMIRSCI